MRSFIIAVVVLVLGAFVVTKCVDVANSKEPTTLDDALNRPVVVQKYEDKENGVVCYWRTNRGRLANSFQCVNVKKNMWGAPK
jgi:hypothetical protein